MAIKLEVGDSVTAPHFDWDKEEYVIQSGKRVITITCDTEAEVDEVMERLKNGKVQD